MNSLPPKTPSDGEGGIGSAYETLGYLRANLRRSMEEQAAMIPQIQKRLTELGAQSDAAEDRGDTAELRHINEESVELQNALKLIRHDQELPS